MERQFIENFFLLSQIKSINNIELSYNKNHQTIEEIDLDIDMIQWVLPILETNLNANDKKIIDDILFSSEKSIEFQNLQSFKEKNIAQIN
jgi:hypothetical protein